MTGLMGVIFGTHLFVHLVLKTEFGPWQQSIDE